MTPRVAGLVLAAGRGRRLGRPKALLELDGTTFLDRAVLALRGGGCTDVVVVSGAVALPGAVHNPDWRSGMGSSLRVGLGALPAAADAVVVTLVDTPLVSAEHVRRLLAARAAGADVAVAAYDGVRRTPVMLARPHWPRVAELAVGDVGARPFLREHPGVVEVPCGDLGPWLDVDEPEALDALRPWRGDHRGDVGAAPV